MQDRSQTFVTTDFIAPVPGFGGRYLITRTGVVYDTHKQRQLRADVPNRTSGYYVVQLRNPLTGMQQLHNLHHLLGLAFLVQSAGTTFVDHRDQNRTNNALENLRWVTVRENNWNKNIPGKSSRFIGVSRTKHGSWVAQLRVKGKQQYLGTYRRELDAAYAFNLVALSYGFQLPPQNAALYQAAA